MKKPKSITYTLLLGFTLLGVTALTVSYWFSTESRKMHLQAVADHSFLYLLNMILETRRFEKNYVIFGDKNYSEMALNYLDQTERQLREYRWAFLSRDDGEKTYQEMSTLLREYRENFLNYSTLKQQNSQQALTMEKNLHQLGTQWISLAEKLTADSNDNVTTILHTIENVIILYNIFFIILLLACGIWFHRKTIQPLVCIQDSLTAILAGRQERISSANGDAEHHTLARVINMTVDHLSRNQEERVRLARQEFADAFMLRLVRMLGQPMDNISTSCQILLEENPRALSTFHRDMLIQIQQQAEQGGKLLAAAQERFQAGHDPTRVLNLSKLSLKALDNLRREQGKVPESLLEIPDDLKVRGNPLTLERGLCDLFTFANRAAPENEIVVIRGCRRTREEMLKIRKQSTLRPLTWISQECDTVAEIAMEIPWKNRFDDVEPNHGDLLSLCVPLEDGHPGIALLPTMLREHEGGLLAEFKSDDRMLFRLWLPATQEDT
ncbi:MAG: HAMP domain-containing histidine kinase [Magnetococcales bacterium]|nr:HAMP domain-containing histidine kinase [Magnetococcales bacterium]